MQRDRTENERDAIRQRKENERVAAARGHLRRREWVGRLPCGREGAAGAHDRPQTVSPRGHAEAAVPAPLRTHPSVQTDASEAIRRSKAAWCTSLCHGSGRRRRDSRSSLLPLPPVCSLGALALPAEAVGPDTQPILDPLAVERAVAEAPWAAATLHAVVSATSLRSAAAELTVHHSTLQERLGQTEHLLGWEVHAPRGRLRLHLALAVRRLRRTENDVLA